MQFSNRREVSRWLIIISSFVIVVLILWNTYIFFQIFKDEERKKINLWSLAQKTLTNATENTDIDLPFAIINQDISMPIIITTQEGKIINHKNIEDRITNDSVALKKLLRKITTENVPIKMELSQNNYQLIYYGESSLLTKMKYYPIALVLIIVLFGAVVYNFYRASKMATQNKLWAGMAKETAHQIGTPLSSLIGWLEILKLDNVEESTLFEIQKDINRLQTITDRFSKIGSTPDLELRDIVSETRDSFEYLQSRVSKQVHFTYKAPDHEILIPINPILHSWVMENLLKNAIDAMKGKGKIDILIDETITTVKICITDSGKGIPKNQFSKVFEPGYTTKKRGWGLGLSLTKRIVQEYHKGRIKITQSEIGKGTTFQISFRKGNSI